MVQKKSRKVKPGGKVSGEQVKVPHDDQVTTEKEEKFNFGGLPDIDFKKNLGCG